EGGSGGALALALADRVLMLEHAIFSVASPEAAAAILWKDAARAGEAAEALKLTAQDALRFGIADAVIPEPPGGAHADHQLAAAAVKGALLAQLQELDSRFAPAGRMDGEALLAARHERYRRLARPGAPTV
ncbi:MAG TPA: acetyl-CoA carboxylase carboxyl transferase subunit alpha, partial [Chloroflexota bacterium]|nr:acetyl-CoA carboxylase carboxyl transferase subunit alpha [Chloroflexota bacterium]